jgi:UDP-2,3-diacylglucosamine pyrophosphatase LpxH
MKQTKRQVDVAVISDVHLGTYGCHAKQVLQYLKSIQPKILVLNGDIIDIWQFSKSYWPKSHMKVVKYIMKLISNDVEIYYLPGNHDEMLRRFNGFTLGSFKITNKILLDLDNGKKAWIFHGDVFDVTMQHSKWLAKLGAHGYDTLILINRFVNFISERILHKGKISLSKRIKNGVKTAVKFVNHFEDTAADIGIYNQYDYVVCGHIHKPEMRKITNQHGSIMYLNSGDWIENLTALEYTNGEWSIYQYNEADFVVDELEEELPSNEELFDEMLMEFNLMNRSF